MIFGSQFLTDRRIIDTIGYQRMVDEIPVDQEGTLQGIYHSALYTQHRVAPFVRHITTCYIHATDITYPTVNDNDFAVVTVVDLAGERREADRQERCHFDTRLTHLFEETVTHTPTTYIIVDKTYLDTLTGFRHEGIGNQTA